MVTSLIKSIIQLRRALSSEWEQHKDVVPAVGEPCFVADKNILKIGDGSTKFSDLEPIGVKFTADGKSIVLEDKTFKLIGFESAAVGAQPRKTKNGNIEWVIPVDYADDIADLQSNINTAKVELRARMTDAETAIDKLEDLVGTEKVIYAIASAVKIETDRAEGAEDGIDKRVKTIESDYLKKSDKEDLQSQINTIASSPDIENVISSINEFTQYIEEHGEIADGFRTDIDTNKENIGDLDARLQAVEESGSGEVNWDDIIGKPEVEAQVQADFAQADSTAPDYIKNRTHGVNYTRESIFVDPALRAGGFYSPEDVPSWSARLMPSQLLVDLSKLKELVREGNTVELSSCIGSDPRTIEFVDKVTYHTCTVDGTEYEYYVSGNRYYLSNNPSMFKMDLGSPVNTGENSAVVVECHSNTDTFYVHIIFKTPTSDIPKFKLDALTESIMTLDEKYIPDTIARVSDIQTLIDNSLGVIENGSY